MYESVKTEIAIKKMIGAIADMRGVYRYKVWQEVMRMVYNNLDDKQKEFVRMRLRNEGIDIEEII